MTTMHYLIGILHWKAGWIEVAQNSFVFKKGLRKCAPFSISRTNTILILDWKISKEEIWIWWIETKAITDFMDKFEKNLTSEENASKALFTTFFIDEIGKGMEMAYW